MPQRQQYHQECDVPTHVLLPTDKAAACRTYPVQWFAQYVTLQNISLFTVCLIQQKKFRIKKPSAKVKISNAIHYSTICCQNPGIT
jgi:hypothetical protein